MLFCYVIRAQVDLKAHVGVAFTDLNRNPENVIASGKAGAIAGLGIVFGNRIYGEAGADYFLIHYKRGELVGSRSLGVLVKTKVHTIRIPVQIGFRFADYNKKSFLNVRMFTGPVTSFVIGVVRPALTFFTKMLLIAPSLDGTSDWE